MFVASAYDPLPIGANEKESLPKDTLGTSPPLRWLKGPIMSLGCAVGASLKSSWVVFLNAKGVWNAIGNFFLLKWTISFMMCWNEDRGYICSESNEHYRADAWNRNMQLSQTFPLIVGYHMQLQISGAGLFCACSSGCLQENDTMGVLRFYQQYTAIIRHQPLWGCSWFYCSTRVLNTLMCHSPQTSVMNEIWNVSS